MKGVHLRATGPSPQEEDWEEMEPVDLLKANWLLHPKGLRLYPPLEVINQYLSRGIDDKGMSGGMMWEECRITEDEYSEFVKSLDGKIAAANEIPSDIETMEHWYQYQREILYSVPYEGQRKLQNEIEKLKAQQKEASDRGEESLLNQLYWEERRLMQDSVNYFRSHFKRPEK